LESLNLNSEAMDAADVSLNHVAGWRGMRSTRNSGQ